MYAYGDLLFTIEEVKAPFGESNNENLCCQAFSYIYHRSVRGTT